MYYLPIKLYERRIHICEMSDELAEPVFGFLFSGDTLFQTNPHGKNILIADRGENIDLADYHFEIKEENDSNCGLQSEVASISAETCEPKSENSENEELKQEASTDTGISETEDSKTEEVKPAEGANTSSGFKKYVFSIVKNSGGNNSNESDSKHVIPDNLPFAIDNDNNSFSESGVKVQFKRKGSKRILEEDFIITIQIEIEDETFSYSFKGYPAEEGYKGNIAEAAIDFGSEASQIRVASSPVNINRVFKENYYAEGFHKVKVIGSAQNNTSKQEASSTKKSSTSAKDSDTNDPSQELNKEVGIDELWQSDANPTLFRSNYFIHKSPKETKFGEEPNKYGEKTFVQALMPLTVDKQYYDDLLLLPNLKLMDLMGNTSEEMLEVINPDDGDRSELLEGVIVKSLSDPHFRQNTLRLILNNLLHCAIAATIQNKNKKYLRIVMLMPNVYDQKKVYNIVEGLYRDFDIMIKGDDDNVNKKFKGIEVSVISESDASFLGVLKTHSDWVIGESDAYSKYYLIIDAGKGTTDFSVMYPENNNITVWNSLFRGGLPASGHALTYAIYEAIWAFFKGVKTVDLDELIREADRAEVRKFMNYLEVLKANYSIWEEKTDNEITIPGRTDLSSLNNINTAIENFIIQKKCLVEGTREIMKNKLVEMSKLIVKGIKQYMDSTNNKENFGGVFLAGRAFMLKEFKDALIKELKDKGLVKSENDIKVMSDEELKTICLDGSAALSKRYCINNNSELICRPVVSGFDSKKRNDKKTKKWWSPIVGWLMEESTPVRTNAMEDEDFYYDGIPVTDLKEPKLTMGLRSDILFPGTSHIYYVGRGLLIKHENGDFELDSLDKQRPNNAEEIQMIDRLIRESLFPYYPSSIPESGKHEPPYNNENRDYNAKENNDEANSSSAVDANGNASDGNNKVGTKESGGNGDEYTTVVTN